MIIVIGSLSHRWVPLRASLHDPLLMLDVESSIPGGVLQSYESAKEQPEWHAIRCCASLHDECPCAAATHEDLFSDGPSSDSKPDCVTRSYMTLSSNCLSW